jgi:16S rRNA (cytosine967-C5)-methyltransferase
MNIRAAAVRVISQVIEYGRSLSDCLPDETKSFSDPRDRALLQAICFGVCRWYFRLEEIAQQLMEKPLKQKDIDVHFLIVIGLYQLIYMRIPAYAAVSETVNANKKKWARGLINGVLRQFQRNADEFEETDPFSHPTWMMEEIEKNYPQKWEAILDANNQHPPFALRVNQQRMSREKYLEKLAQAGIVAKEIPETHSGILLENPIDVQQIPGFAAGEASVQDGAAQLAAELLSVSSGQRVLDACAAPGGKTAHILEIQPDVELIALDQDEERLQRVKENLQRLKLSAACVASDAGDVESWWDGKSFDRILLDAPCSASGVIRRHPDIKLLRLDTDIPEFAKEQLRLLTALWTVLKSGGCLVYVTCSVFPEENVHVLKSFLKDHPEAKEEKISATWGMECEVGRQILPGEHNMDGFYYACLRKI